MSDSSQTTAIRSAFHEWAATRTLLSSTFQAYTNACSTLYDTCTQPSYYPAEHTIVEDALVAVNCHLSSLAAEYQTLRETVVKLSTLRNRSSRLTRANALPPEVLAHIFRYANCPCVRDESSMGHYNTLTVVSAYWRQVALNTPELWTHVDISPKTATRSPYRLAATTKIKRARGLLLHIHLHQPHQTHHQVSDQEARRFWAFLVPHLARTIELTMEAPVHHAFNLCANSSQLSALKTFTASFADDIPYPPFLHFWDQDIPLDTLRYRNTSFPEQNFVFQNLVELQLAATATHNYTIFVSYLAEVLGMNPLMTTLKLDGIKILDDSGDDEAPQVTLEHLKVLNLVTLSADDLKAILPIINQSNPAAHLGVGLTFYDELRDEYRDFFSRCRVATLYQESTSGNFNLDGLPTDLARLVVFRSDVSRFPYLSTERHLHIPDITLVSCVMTLEGLLALIDRLGVQHLRLDMCITGQLMELDGVIEKVSKEMKIALYDARPGVVCVVSDVDSCSDMPCRVTF